MAFQGQVKELKKRQHYCYDPFQHHEKKQYKTLRVVTRYFLRPHGPGQFFSFRDPPDIFTVDLNDLLLAVKTKTTTGRSYFITSKESEGATKALNLHHR